MSRNLSEAVGRVVHWLGFSKEKLPDNFKQAVERYAENGARKVTHSFTFSLVYLDSSSIIESWRDSVDSNSVGAARILLTSLEVNKFFTRHRNDGSSPVHQSRSNRQDTANVISARITPADGGRPRTHHIYEDGTGTLKKGDSREYSTLRRDGIQVSSGVHSEMNQLGYLLWNMFTASSCGAFCTTQSLYHLTSPS